MVLNEKKIKEFVAREKEYKISDGNGLTLRVFPSGKKSWLFQYFINKKRYNISFGLYPTISLKMAREKALELKSEVFKGKNPKIEIEAEKNVNTFKVMY